MKKAIFISIALAVGVALFIVTGERVGWTTIGGAFKILGPLHILALVLVNGFSFILSAWRWQLIMKGIGMEKTPFFPTFVAKTVGYAISYITPSVYIGGEPLRAWIYREETKSPWDKTVASIIADQAIDLTIAFLFVALGGGIVLLGIDLPFRVSLIVFSTIGFCAILTVTFYWRIMQRKGFFLALVKKVSKFRKNDNGQNQVTDWVKETEEIVSDYFQNRDHKFWLVVLLGFFIRFFSFLTAWLVVVFLGASVNFFYVLAFITLILVIYFLPVPAAFGVHEGSQALIFSYFGLGASTGVAFSLILRGLAVAGTLFGLLFLFYFQWKTCRGLFGRLICRIRGQT